MSITREMIVDGIVEPAQERKSIIKPYVMSHGTLECRNMKDSRKFYEEFLGLECVRHALPAMVIRCGLKFHIVCVEVGDNVHPLNVLNHWGIDVESREKVDEAYQNALKYQEAYKIKQVMKPNLQHGVYSFYLEDLDHNWWEVQSIDGFQHDDMFDFGDRFTDNDAADVGALDELKVKNSAH
ncbi:VOC family protein [Methylocella sp. CPCC 101449]|jgi:catechol 2,3-dioxygenase-like lactoylglutathione lyase family enzyme|uniref:VOC family protein n=1 Tax=Methylocella sp. CPCC 101449 TaxID=2987531 RepID=UPI002891D300|nr:VOC family protein [Methylocella sp. CPCC 101449]MDT2020271.1 VOC family protein [Methylocella sp. CPCC 101449]HEV2574789.1 VOC family protein [Beijerinckiaceae bacterium]